MMDFDDGKGVMDEGKRNARNLSEKKRRDQFNTLLTELGNILNVMPEAAGQVAALQVCSLSTTLFLYCEKIFAWNQYRPTLLSMMNVNLNVPLPLS